MLKDNAIPIRLDTGTKERLKDAAERLDLSSSALIRILIASFVKQFEASGGRITLPLQWEVSDHAAAPRPTPPRPPEKAASSKSRGARNGCTPPRAPGG